MFPYVAQAIALLAQPTGVRAANLALAHRIHHRSPLAGESPPGSAQTRPRP